MPRYPKHLERPIPRLFKNRNGMSLLEVLVSLGILVAGLASVAALMPAAGARLADATAIDRASALAANVHADLRIRLSLTGSALFSGTGPQLAISGDMFSALTSDTVSFNPSPKVFTTFTLTQDDLQLDTSGTTVTPNPASVCYGVTVIPLVSTTTPIGAGTPAKVSVATFKKPDVESKRISLTQPSTLGPGLFLTGSDAAADSLRKQFLSSCAWVLASSTSGTTRPTWLRVGSSWTTTDSTGLPNGSYVSFSDPTATASFVSSGTMTVYGFTRILRVDERPVTLR